MDSHKLEERLRGLEQQVAELQHKQSVMNATYSKIIKQMASHNTNHVFETGQFYVFLTAFISVIVEKSGLDPSSITSRIRQISESPASDKTVANALLRFLPLFEKASPPQKPENGDPYPSWLLGVFQDGVFRQSNPNQTLDQGLDNQPNPIDDP